MIVELTQIALLAALTAAVVGLNAHRIGNSARLLDFPDPVGGRKRHTHVTPLVGGISALVPSLVALFWTVTISGHGAASILSDLTWLGGVAGIVFVIGLVDDRRGLAPSLRLLVASASLAMAFLWAPALLINELNFRGLPLTIQLGPLAPLFTLVCVVGLLNAVNMADGKNGLVISMSLTWTVFLAIYAPPELYPVLVALGAALSIAFIFNMRGIFFLGDAGSYGLAALLGLLAIMVYSNGEGRLDAGQVAVWFAIPVFDCLRLIVGRTLRGRSPFSPDRNHLHHHLGRSFGWPKGLGVYWALVTFPSILAMIEPDYSLVMLFLQALAYIGVIAYSHRRQPTSMSTAI